MHTLRQPFAAAANHFLELRLDFGEAGRPIHCHDCVAPAAAPAAAERGEDAGEGESVVEGEVPRPSLSESDEFSHERARGDAPINPPDLRQKSEISFFKLQGVNKRLSLIHI